MKLHNSSMFFAMIIKLRPRIYFGRAMWYMKMIAYSTKPGLPSFAGNVKCDLN